MNQCKFQGLGWKGMKMKEGKQKLYTETVDSFVEEFKRNANRGFNFGFMFGLLFNSLLFGLAWYFFVK